MEGEQVQTQYDPQLIEAVRKQIEYYFSMENLQNDVYLTQQMDASRSVPISVVMKFAKLKALTQDEAIVRQSLVDSTVTIVDNRIKANIKTVGRSTIILRDVPSDASEESVKEIFNYPGSKPIVSVRSDIGDTWFVVLETEQDAKDTLLDLKLKKRLFNGQSVKARIKTENVVRSYYPVPTIPPIAPVYPVMAYPGMVPAPIEMVPFGYMAVGPVDPATIPTEAPVEPVPAESQEKTTDDDNNQDANKSANRSSVVRDPRVTRPARTLPPRDSAPLDRRPRTEGRRTGGEGRSNPSGKDREKKVETSAKPPIEINALTFPPLHVADDTPIPTPGYKEDYQKYNMDEIINIVKEVKEAALPVEVDAEAHSLAITATPNLDLLKRQRTFSIDETREQLRQGRPVLKDAIIPGAVDYRSMMYGDDSQGGKQSAMKKAEADKKVEQASSSASTEQPIPMETGSQSPARFSSSTWAAMVKSAAADPAPVATLPVKTPAKSIDSAKKQPQSAAKAPAEKAPSSNGTNNKKEKTEGKVEKKGNNKSKDDKKKEKDSDDKKNDQEHKQEGESSTDAPAVSWGGKASFANVLKQKLAEEPAQPVVPVVKQTKQAEQGKSTEQGKSKGSNNSSNSRSKDNKRTSNADSDGMWVKETLPALEK